MLNAKQFLLQVPAVEKILHHHFSDPYLLLTAFTHPSYLNENSHEVKEDNERLEFLGDSIFNMIITSYLYDQFPHFSEGKLSSFRSLLINKKSCFLFMKKLPLEPFILLGKGEITEGVFKKNRTTILANLFEAIIAAIYLDGGWDQAKRFVFFHFYEEIEKIWQRGKMHAKTALQRYTLQHYGALPEYEMAEERTKGHRREFRVSLSVKGNSLGFGWGNSKKEAERAAAESALDILGISGHV